MKIIFRADDLGFSEGVNCGIYRAVKDGPDAQYASGGRRI